MEVLTPADFAAELTSEDFETGPASRGISRRVVIKGLGSVSVALLLGTMGGCDKILEQIKNRPIRRRLRTGSAEVDADIATYRDAVTAMKALPGSNPTSWIAQAGIHGTVAGGFLFCEHGTDHFFDWHRAYLFNFEKICQKLTGKPKFGLPYWNWNQNPAMNPAYLNPASTLFLGRNTTDLTGFNPISTAELDPILADTNFLTFMHQIEGTPHNQVHSRVGQTMGTGGSSLDPIFWNHHCMVDYCWAKWNIEMGNSTTNDPAWLNHVNEHFVDADGNASSSTAAITTLMPLLSYQYESSAIGSHPATRAISSTTEYQRIEKRLREGANVRFDIKQRVRLAERTSISLARPFSAQTKLTPQDFSRIINADTEQERVFASIAYAQLPANSDFSVRVFVNLPDANPGTPTTDPHYAGSFGFFGTLTPDTASGHQHQPTFLVNLTNTIQRLKRTPGALTDTNPLSVQLVVVPFGGTLERADTQLALEGIDIVTTPVIINPPS